MGFTLPWAGVTPAPNLKMQDFVFVRTYRADGWTAFLTTFFVIPLRHPERALSVILERSEEYRLPEACTEKDRTRETLRGWT